MVLGDPGPCAEVADPDRWPGLRNLLQVRTERKRPYDRRHAIRYYIAIPPVETVALLDLVRGNWGVENDLYSI